MIQGPAISVRWIPDASGQTGRVSLSVRSNAELGVE
jgi:hypothetical protein